MLTELSIRNFAIIDDLRIQFGSGLNILTGETGAGKSIIIDAIGLLMGDRASSEWIRASSDVAVLEAQFDLSGHKTESSAVARTVEKSDQPPPNQVSMLQSDVLKSLLEENGLDDPDSPGWLTLSREVRASGRNICRINGRVASLQLLAQVASLLVDVHGQGEHLNLLQPHTHVNLLDRYGHLEKERQSLAAVVVELRSIRQELDRLRTDARTVMQRVDILTFQTEEITNANLQPSEEDELEAERNRLGNAETLLSLAQSSRTILEDGDAEAPSAIDLVGEVVTRLGRLASIDSDYTEQATTSQTILEQLSELSADLQDYADNLEFNPVRLQDVEERIELIHGLKRKYGDSIEEILAFGASAEEELERLGNWEARTEELEAQEARLLKQIGEMGSSLSKKRVKAGEAMSAAVEAELQDLRMQKARFGVSIVQQPNENGALLADGNRVAFDAKGIDKVEFLISANPGEPLKPLAKVASGGETARIMLALKGVLAQADATPTLVFDEIDQGIGGRVGGIVGKKLWALTGQSESTNSTQHQVLCITHLPQLAAFGDMHYAVSKRIESANGTERTATDVQLLSGDDRVEELVQMLGSDSISGRQSVEEILADAERAKVHARGREGTEQRES